MADEEQASDQPRKRGKSDDIDIGGDEVIDLARRVPSNNGRPSHEQIAEEKRLLEGEYRVPKSLHKDGITRSERLPAAALAFHRLVQLSKSRNEGIALRACEVILERAFGKSRQQVDLKGDHTFTVIIE